MGGVHATVGSLLAVPLLGLVALAAGAALTRRGEAWVERVRLGVLALLVVESAIGLALALRGGAPAEWLHWPYAAAAGLALLLPGAMSGDAPGRRAMAVGVAAVFALLMSWRLAATG